MKFLVIGHLCRDFAHAGAGTVTEQWGGIANAVATLGVLAGKNDTVVPVCGVGAADQDAFLAWSAAYPSVDPAGIYVQDAPTNSIHVYEQPTGLRVACAAVIAPPIPFEKLKKFLGADSIIVNMASGFDITLETLDMIRMEVRPRSTPIHFDYHNLSMGVSGESERFRRPLPDWRRWAFMNASVQLNEAEAFGLALEKLSEAQIVGHFLTLGVHGVLLTRGAGGSSVFTSEHKKVLRRDFPAEGSSPGHDPTGLGDIFGAAFAFQYAQKADMVAAAEVANRFAGAAAALPRAERCAPPLGTTRSPR